MNDILFETNDGVIVTNRDILTAARIVGNDPIDAGDYESIRRYAYACKGIKKELINPSIEYLLEHDAKVLAIKMYHDNHRWLSLAVAKKIVDDIESDMKCESAN